MHKVYHYLPCNAFIISTDRCTPKCLVTKLVRHDRIYIWLLFFQGFNFWRIGKPCESRVNLDHLSKIESGEVPITIDEDPSDSYLFELIDFLEDLVEI